MTITKDKFAAINYILKDTQGVELDSSTGTEPLGYIHGRGYLIPGLEAQLEGKTSGDKFSCIIEPQDAYGERDERLVAQVTRDKFEEGSPIEIGMHFQVMTPAGPSIVRITEINDDTITIDGNHEMAGKTLNFEIEVVEVRDPTPQELEMLEQRSCGGCGGCGGGGCGDCGSDGCSGEGCGNCGN
ncbi:MAG: peptidylprolyl isomerase [Treponema sp.]|nr:peptidylprolyl isomerase [Treponema sp.]